VLREDEIEAVAATIEQPSYSTLVYVLAYGGLRWGEACALQRRRCDLLRSRVEVVESLAEISGRFEFGEPKTYARRWVRLPRFVADMLAVHLESVPADPDALVFTWWPDTAAQLELPALGVAASTPGGGAADGRSSARLPAFLRLVADPPGGQREGRATPTRPQHAHGHAERLRPPLRGRPGAPLRAPGCLTLGIVTLTLECQTACQTAMGPKWGRSGAG
jgi:hypothetical protein